MKVIYLANTFSFVILFSTPVMAEKAVAGQAKRGYRGVGEAGETVDEHIGIV